MSSTDARATGRPRGRPRRDSAAPPLTRDLIADTALALTADEGFPALTMRSLAARLDVTVRALYNHVTDRQDVVDLVAARLIDLLPDHEFDVDDWRRSVHDLYTQARASYRRAGRAVLFALDETVTPSELNPERILSPERLLAFLTDLGLDLETALIWRTQFLTDIFGYALLIDYTYDRADTTTRRAMQDPVPAAWLDAHPHIDAPVSRRATALPDLSSDAVFEHTITRAILVIEHALHEH